MINTGESNSHPILSITDVSKTFGGVRAVSGLDLTVNRGELRCLIGPNGAGKSTVFKLIMGSEQPTSGVIRFNDVIINKMKPWKRARLGLSIKMQIPSVYADLSVYDNMRVSFPRG
jgi:branched-chain amino acid transport system ATP-binding protein